MIAKWTPNDIWKGQDAFLVGGGSSLRMFDFHRLAGRNVIGCNDAFRLGPEIVRICIFGDSSWWQKVKWELEKFSGYVVTSAPTLAPFKIPGVYHMTRIKTGLGNGNTLAFNYSTGAEAINLAVTAGATRVFLLGYDLSTIGSLTHWHNSRTGKQTPDEVYERFSRGFALFHSALAATGQSVQVFNVTDGSSRLTVFPRIDWAQFHELTGI